MTTISRTAAAFAAIALALPLLARGSCQVETLELPVRMVGPRAVATVEINGTFYSLQHHTSFQRWREETPDDFVFAVKGSRFITHMKKLADVQAPLGTFLASGVLSLGDRLGPLLWQLPPNLGFHPDRLAAFFDLLPRRTTDASAFAAAHLAEGKAVEEVARHLEIAVNAPVAEVRRVFTGPKRRVIYLGEVTYRGDFVHVEFDLKA